MTTKQAIEKAIEGGWSYHKVSRCQRYNPELNDCECGYHIFLDPLFWRSLGTALGWPEDTSYCDHCGEADIADEYITNDEEHSDCSNLLTFPKYWRYQWHRFIDVLSEGKSADDFFKEL